MGKFHYLQKEKIAGIPKLSGVYSFRNDKKILYIGKAANLRTRVKNHFSQPTWQDNHFIDQATHVGYIKTDSEIEALLLESQLIKKYQPRYNIQLRDDKQYFYVCFTGKQLPLLTITHQPPFLPHPLSPSPSKGEGEFQKNETSPPPYEGGGRGVVGPFTDGRSLKTVLRYLRKAFPYYTQKHRKLPCSYCHLGLCPGPDPDTREYKKNIATIKAILNGKRPRVISSLKKEMSHFAKNLEFEKAAKVRGQIAALENIFAHRSGLAGAAEETEKIIPLPPLGSLEAYDISNIQGREPVASMVRFDNGRPNKSMYRKFKIRLPQKPNDTAMISEVIRRRLTHPEWPYPDVFLIDGGRGQLNAALSEVRKFQAPLSLRRRGAGGEVVALAKRFNELYMPGRKNPIPLDTLPKETKNLLMYARDEAHRFAISYHRKLHRQTFK